MGKAEVLVELGWTELGVDGTAWNRVGIVIQDGIVYLFNTTYPRADCECGGVWYNEQDPGCEHLEAVRRCKRLWPAFVGANGK